MSIKKRNIKVTRAIISLLLTLGVTQGMAQIAELKALYSETLCDKCSISFVQADTASSLDVTRLEQIILIRHGEPDLIKEGWFTRNDAIKFSRAYDSVGVKTLVYFPLNLFENESVTLLSSSLPRAKHTAQILFGDARIVKEDSLFREFERKIFKFPNLKMPIKFWTFNSRLLWLLGLNDKDIESKKEAKARARRAADTLTDFAAEKQKVILVAHGFLNRQLITNLKKEGWAVIRKGGSDYLSTTLLVRIKQD